MSDRPFRLGATLPRQPRRSCPECGTTLDGATELVQADLPAVKKVMPVGSLTVCLYCAQPLELRAEGFKALSPAEVDSFCQSNPGFRTAINAVTAMRNMRGRKT